MSGLLNTSSIFCSVKYAPFFRIFGNTSLVTHSVNLSASSFLLWNITLYKLQSLTGVSSSTISQFLIRIQDYKEVSTPFVKEVIDTGIKVA